MHRLDSDTLSPDAAAHLLDLQEKVAIRPDFLSKVQKVQKLWDGKKQSHRGQSTFDEISKRLHIMGRSSGLCCYCEQNEHSDIEHIYPKSLFPSLAFEWENYVPACKLCNMGHKGDRFAVLDHDDNLEDLQKGVAPRFNRAGFINPRLEDPNGFMVLNLKTFKFDIMPDLSKAARNKAEKTIEILHLNDRAPLIEMRRSIANSHYDYMYRLARIQKSTDIEQVKEILSPHDDELEFEDLEQVKATIYDNFKKRILSHAHPSVWYAIKMISSKTDPKWRQIFNIIPDALNW